MLDRFRNLPQSLVTVSSVCGSLSGSHFDCSRAESLHLHSHPLRGVSPLYRRVNHHSRVHSSEVVSKMLAEDDAQMDKEVVDVPQNVSQNETQQPFVEKTKDDDAVEEPKNVYREGTSSESTMAASARQ